MWEVHCTSILKAQGWVAVEGMPGCFVHMRVGSDLLPAFLVVYVDDFVMSGRSLSGLWKGIMAHIKFGEEPAPIGRYLGVRHDIHVADGVMTCAFDMSEFACSCVARYVELTGMVKLPHADAEGCPQACG